MVEKELVLDDFEHGDITRYGKKHTFVKSYRISICDSNSKYGNNCLKLSYDFSGWTTGNGAMYILFRKILETKRRPLKLGMWIHGDGRSPWLRAVLVDGHGQQKTLNLTKSNIDWFGWKYVDATIDPNWTLPLTLEKIYAVEIDKTLVGNGKYEGEILFDRIRFVYIDDEDLVGPSFYHFRPEESVIYHDSFLISVSVTDEMTGVDPKTIHMQINGKKVEHHYCLKQGIISYQLHNLKENIYRILITASDYAGNISLPYIDKKITINLSPDTEKPVISNITPTESAVCLTRTPRITCNIIDYQSGIEQKDIEIVLNKEKLKIAYDEKTGWCYGYPRNQLKNGEHVFTIKVKDRAGNQIGPIIRKFFVHSLPEEVNASTCKFLIIPDTHSSEYAKFVFNHVAEENFDLILHMGDMVDQATLSEYEQMQRMLSGLLSRKLLTVAGNHESFQGNLDLYMKYFGSPTYHLEISSVLLIVLNSAFEQSITESDSTQFHYLESLLNKNEKKNIIIVTHVPSEDPFGTAHELVEKDARKLENILSKYKANNPNINIIVLFGHLHTLKMWERDGVQYIVTGNAASKGYVTNDRGNIFGYGIVEAGTEGLNYQYKPFVKRVQILLNERSGELPTIGKDSTHQLRVKGHVNTPDLSYDVDLTNILAVKKSWSTNDGEVVAVDHNGVIYGVSPGTARISVVVSDITSTIKIIVK